MTIVVSAFSCIAVYAQDYHGSMARLVGYVTELRFEGTEDSVLARLVSDGCWTLMDEIGQSDGECSRSVTARMERFGINDLAYRAESRSRGKFVSSGNFCNGTDPRYNYSFIEKAIVAGKSVSYNIPGRIGLQTFVIVPFSKECDIRAGLVTSDGDVSGVRGNDGNVIIEADAGNSGNDMVLCVENRTGKDISCVIINFNSRSSATRSSSNSE